MKSPPFGEEPFALQLSAVQKEFFLNAISDLRADLRDVSPEEREEAIRKRILDVQKDVVHQYHCLRSFRFVTLRMAEHDDFPRILRLSEQAALDSDTRPLFLDIGCCLGTDLRYLAYAGYPAQCLLGCDLRPEFIDIGYRLYGDRDFCKIRFFSGDILQLESPASTDSNNDHSPLKDVNNLSQLCARVKYIYAGSLFHLFDEGVQESIASRMASLVDARKETGQAVIFGRQLGRAQEGPHTDNSPRYIHSPASWERMWRRVLGEDANVEVVATLRPLEDPSLYWSVWIA
ncbi:hypothetical protein EDD16DRAFT_1495300 [Pisolithus croceorrhizus]|nr:hypothetical protein EDD16DRAFT_1495300 [Pisolithus croceorrhizus]KAI6120228.1 hypothetical protein EV401DRAFT_1860122 [Pisolithus croceorrhizus]KAI6169871.1 hypothetical protein EDD17DRAFT_1463804 [Pisolithus thermaeus]